jgi:rSAM/selenodomain-associated transferase 2
LTLAVVIPTWNEEAALPVLLDSLRRQTQPAQRILVVDAGSTDRTVSEASRAGAEVVTASTRGRGNQIAAGLARVSEEIVLVAHADMILPTNALQSIRRALSERPGCPGGCLGHRFERATLVLKVIEWWDRRRARSGESYGDQAQFFRRQLLQSVGGFPEQPIMEDVELSRRLRRLGIPLYLDAPVIVSGRRFRQGHWWMVLWTNWAIRRRYRRNGIAACADLHQRYYART